MKNQGALGNSMLKMMTGIDASIKVQPVNVDSQSIHSRANKNIPGQTIRKDPENNNNLTQKFGREPSVFNMERDKMTISMKRDGDRNQILVILEGQDQEEALQIQIDEIREKAQNQNYNWEIFDIKQELGQGTFGQVFACLDQKTGKKFALKFIGYEMESDQDPDFKSAVKEIVIMQTLSKSANVSLLKIHDVYPCIKEDHKYLVIVMELCDCNLMELIRTRIEENRSKWSDEELFYMLNQLVEGFLKMKQLHVTHRDIKPQNILYSTADKNYKIADFGGAKFHNPNTQKDKKVRLIKAKTSEEEGLNTVRGSPAYWSPEIYYFCDLMKNKDGGLSVGKQHLPYDPYLSDVYSLGITFLLMKKLMPRIEREQIKVEAENLRRLKNPTPFEQILAQMLEYDEKTRITFEGLAQRIRQETNYGKQPNEDVYVNCLKTGKDKKNMNPQDLMQREINLADAYEKLFMLVHARTHYDLALKYASKLSKENFKADILNSLGTVNCDIGDLDEAERNYIESAALYKKIYGDKHTSVADAYNNIGIAKRKKGDFKGAIKYYEQAYGIKEQVFGENNLGGALILSNIGLAYRKLGNLDQSIKYYRNALQIKKLICGDRSLILCGTYDNLARVYFLKQQYDLAISCYQITADIYRRYLNSNQTRLADSLFELGLCFQNLGRYQEATKCYQETFQLRKDNLGPLIKSTIVSQEHLAQCLLEEGKHEQSIEVYESLKNIYNKGLLKCPIDERIDSIIDVLKNLGAAYMGTMNYQNAIANYNEALSQLKKRQSDNKVNESSRQAKIQYNLGLVYRKIGDIEKAKQNYNQAISQIINCTNQNDLMLLGDIYNNMGVLYGMSQDFKNGKVYFQQALEKYQQVYGKGHQICKEVEINLQEIDKLVEQQKEQRE